LQFYYGTQMPLRVLDETEFWKEQEKEHTVVIRELVKDLEKEYVEDMEQWEKALSETGQKAKSFIETVIRSGNQLPPSLYQDVIVLVNYSVNQSNAFIQYLRKLKQESTPIKNNPTAITVLDHIIDESQYFVGIAQTILYANN
jgi:actin-like ATPase involved in cell morphogenesis